MPDIADDEDKMIDPTIHFHVGPEGLHEACDRIVAAWERVAADPQGYHPTEIHNYNDLDTLWKLLSRERLDLMQCLIQNPGAEVDQLARLTKRPIHLVWEDVRDLLNFNLLHRQDGFLKVTAEKITITVSLV